MPTYIRVKDLPNAATSPASDDFILLSGTANGARRISRADFLSAVAGFYTADPSTYKLATLDAGNKVLVSQLPSAAFSYKGTWAASSNTPSLANGTGTGGDTYYASDSGSVNFGAGSISFLAGDAVVHDGTIWQKVPDVVNLLDGKGTLDEAKTTLEIPDVGLQPNQVPLSGQLGTMAFQDADGVSVGTLTASGKTTLTNDSDNALVVETTNQNPMIVNVVGTAPNYLFDVRDDDTSKFRVDGAGRVGIGDTSPDNKLTIGEGNIQLQGNKPPNAEVYHINWKNTNSTGFDVARIAAATGTNIYEGELRFLTKDSGGTMATRWSINSSGNLVSSGGAIDFGSTTTGTGTPSGGLLSDYEEGTFTPSLQFGGGDTGITYSARSGYYTKVGRLVAVHYYIVLTSKGTSTGNASITGGPFVSAFNGGGLAASVIHSYYMASLTGTPFANQGMYSNTVLLWDTVASGRDPLTDANFSNTSAIDCTLTFEV